MRAGDAHATLRALPVVGLDALLANRTPLILAPHPDDESLGCGGLIAEACCQGRPPERIPWVLVMTDGTGSHPGSREYPAPRLRALREGETRNAVTVLGLPAERLGFLGLRDTAAPTAGPAFDAAVDAVVALCRRQRLDLLLAPWVHDPHCDHEATHLIAAAAAAALGVAHMAYPVWGWTLPAGQVLPDTGLRGVRLDVSAHLAAKQRAIQAHRSQYSDLITDDPNGFRLPRALLSAFETPYETFIEVSR